MILARAVRVRSISAVVALEIPSLVPKESKLFLVDSLGIIRSVVGSKNIKEGIKD